MKLSTLLNLQLVYVVIGILFNIVSWWGVSKGEPQLTINEPISGMIAMSTYGLFLIPGKIKYIKLYRVLMGLSVVLFGYGGVIVHILTYPNSPELYHSLGVCILGASINVYGLILNIIAVLGIFKIE